jgi:long-subunit acyl-CoA synthetase (AMP-forming)
VPAYALGFVFLIVSVSFTHSLSRACMQNNIIPTSDDVHVSYLPLAHMFERIVQVMLWCHGAGVGFYSGVRLFSLRRRRE